MKLYYTDQSTGVGEEKLICYRVEYEVNDTLNPDTHAWHLFTTVMRAPTKQSIIDMCVESCVATEAKRARVVKMVGEVKTVVYECDASGREFTKTLATGAIDI